MILETVQEQLKAITHYIETTYFSEQAGATIYPPYDTPCIVLGDYLAFYHILEDKKAVFVSDIIHSKQDYIRLFKKK